MKLYIKQDEFDLLMKVSRAQNKQGMYEITMDIDLPEASSELAFLKLVIQKL